MESIRRAEGVLFAIAVACAGCAGAPPDPDPEVRVAVAREALDLISCELAVADCILNAGGLAAIAACRADFFDCADQTAQELVDTATDAIGAADDCRTSTMDCIAGASGVSDVLACRTEFEGCIDALVAIVPDVTLPGGVTLPNPGITLSSAIDCPTVAIDCVQGASSVSGVLACRAGFESCLGDLADQTIADATNTASGLVTSAGSVVNQVTSIAGLPQTADVLAAADACKAEAEDCVQSAVSAVFGGTVTLATCRANFEMCLDEIVATVP